MRVGDDDVDIVVVADAGGPRTDLLDLSPLAALQLHIVADIDDAIEELRDKLIKRLQTVQVKASVKSIKFSERGYEDIEVVLSID